MAVVAVGALSMAQYDKAVALSLDGDTSSVHVFGSTVGDLLAKQDLAIGEHDLVQPSADAALHDGDTVVVRYGRKLTVTVTPDRATYRLEDGDPIDIRHHGRQVTVDHADLVLDIPPAPTVEPVRQPVGCEPRRRSR